MSEIRPSKPRNLPPDKISPQTIRYAQIIFRRVPERPLDACWFLEATADLLPGVTVATWRVPLDAMP